MIALKEANAKLAEFQLHSPVLDALIPNEKTYTTLFIQASGEVIADITSIKNKDSAIAQTAFSQFFNDAKNQEVDLAVTPEYSCPWPALENAVDTGVTPRTGAIWVIGCESTTLAALDTLAERLKNKSQFIYERPAAGTKHFLDPVALIFRTTRHSGEEIVVVMVQFKTEPMAEPIGRLEPDNLICGQSIYRFRNEQEQSISLIVLLCSDSLALAKPEHAHLFGAIGQISPLFLLHLQLNTKPRDTVYCGFRHRLMQQQMEREIFTANWAAGTKICESGWKHVCQDKWRQYNG